MNSYLSPIENLWQEFKVGINCWLPKDLQELAHVPIKEWKEILEKTFSNLIKNFRKLFQLVRIDEKPNCG